MAESVLRDRIEAAGLGDMVEVDSTAITREEIGSRIDRRAARTLEAAGYDPLPRHRAREVRTEQLRERDLVLPMTTQHARFLRGLIPGGGQPLPDDQFTADEGTRPTVIRMYRTFDPAVGSSPDQWGDDLRSWDIADPWYGDQDDFEVTLAQLEAGADAIIAYVQQALKVAK